MRKVGWRGRISQFVLDLEDGKFDGSSIDEAEALETKEDSGPSDNLADTVDTSMRNDDEFGMGPEGEDDATATQGESKPDSN